MWPGTRPTSEPGFILIHPTIWPKYTNVTDRHDRTGHRSDSIGRTVSGRPFVKRFALSYRTVVCLSCPVCNVGGLWPSGWMDQDETWHRGRSRLWPHCVRWGPNSPPPKRSTAAAPAPTFFGPCLLWPNGSTDQDVTWYGPVGLGPGHIMLDGDSPPPKRAQEYPHFPAHVSIVAKLLYGSRCHLVWRSASVPTLC